MIKIEKNIWIVEECSNPTTEYYILSALKILGLEERAKLLHTPPKKVDTAEIILIIVRYLTRDWVNFIEKNKSSIKRILYVMDDDLFDLSSLIGLPIRYIKKIYLKAFRWKSWLIRNGAEFLVSTDFLADKYQYLKPLIIPPYPIFNNSCVDSMKENGLIKVFYHGTSSHRKELFWLYDIVRSILFENNKIIFEIIGDEKVYDKFKALKGVIVVHPMKWETYKKFLLKEKRHIGLAPLLSYKFNISRSYTKFFEIAACGAVGIYSKDSSYGKIISKNEGILLQNKKEEWINSVLRIANDELHRLELYENSLKQIETLRKFSEKIYKENLIWRIE